MITITDEASNELKRMLSVEKELKEPVLRLKVVPGGCSGHSYSMGFEEGTNGADAIYEFNGVKVAVDPSSMPLLEGLRLDYKDGLADGGFKIENPNATATCGCGTSFSA